VEHSEGELAQIPSSQTVLPPWAWLLASQADILVLGLLGDLVTGMRASQMLWQAACSTGKQDETSCGFQKSWQLSPSLTCGRCWLGLGLRARERALELNPICSFCNSGLVVPSPACLSLPVLKMSLVCGWIALLLFLFMCRMDKTFPFGPRNKTTPKVRAWWCWLCWWHMGHREPRAVRLPRHVLELMGSSTHVVGQHPLPPLHVPHPQGGEPRGSRSALSRARGLQR